MLLSDIYNVYIAMATEPPYAGFSDCFWYIAYIVGVWGKGRALDVCVCVCPRARAHVDELKFSKKKIGCKHQVQ